MKEKIYRFSPIWLKTILLNIKSFGNRKKRYSAEYEIYLKEYLNLWHSDLDTILEYQKSKLIDLLLETKEYVSYYKSLFEEFQITDEEIKESPFEVLSKLPLLTKENRKSKVQELINENPERALVETGYTSGTSGSPTLIHLDLESIERAFALWSRFHNTIGLNRKDRSVRFSGRLIINPRRQKPPFWIFNRADNQLFMSSYHLKEENMKDYIGKLNKFKPRLLDGYPSAIYILSKYINSNNLTLSFKPIAIATTAETLHDYQRVEIEKAFKCKVFNQYASAEGSPFITECKAGKLHINLDSGVFEFLNKNNEPAKPGEIGRMVITSFRNYKIPLLRYDILDTVLISENKEKCSCGCQMPYVQEIVGREDDLLWTEEKGFVGRLSNSFAGLEGIIKTQMLQVDKKTLIINQIIDDNYTDGMRKEFLQNLRDRLGEKINIKINYVDDIPLGPNGKFETVKRQFEIEN